jgi:predicted amidophosphoribosyltransferase
MCRYSMKPFYKTHYVCPNCFNHKKEDRNRKNLICNNCGREMVEAGMDFKAPRKQDKKSWVRVVGHLQSGWMYDTGCGCRSRRVNFFKVSHGKIKYK